MTRVIDGVDYGPLAGLIGFWEGDKGMDIAPEPDGVEQNPYYETIECVPSGDVTNGEEQLLAIIRYHQVVKRKSTGKDFHNESGYYTWDRATGVITQSLVIPRGVAVIAGGSARQADGETIISVRASLDDDDYSIVQSPYMRDKASTQSFSHSINVSGERFSYQETTVIDIYGRLFDHTDENTLTKSRHRV